jgi:hypothetical protein
MFEIKSIDQGKRQVHAVIATLEQVDSHFDVVKAGFFGSKPIETPVLAAHQDKQPPMGRALSYERGAEVHSLLTLYETAQGEAWYQAIKADYETGRPLMQYSWGFLPYPDAFTRKGGIRELHARRSDGSPGIQLYEVSPVLNGSSVNTRTLEVKSDEWRVAYWRRWRARYGGE